MGVQRPRKDNIIRYCLPCSESAGKLVERNAPVLDKRRATQADKAKDKRLAKEKREAARERKRTHIELWDANGRVVELDPEQATREIAKLAGIKRGFQFTWKRRSFGFSGRCWSYGRIHLSISSRRGASLEDFCRIAAHELAHFRGNCQHNDTWRDEYERICGVVWGMAPGFRPAVQHHRYAIDPEVVEKLKLASQETDEQYAKRRYVHKGRKAKPTKRALPLIGEFVGMVETVQEPCPGSGGDECFDGRATARSCKPCGGTGTDSYGKACAENAHYSAKGYSELGCGGSGEKPDRDCYKCKGAGFVSKKVVIPVKSANIVDNDTPTKEQLCPV